MSITNNSALTSSNYWKAEAAKSSVFSVDSNEYSSVLEKFLPINPAFTCVEIGAYPGGNLCYLAKRFKYTPTAIEYRDDAEDIRQLFEYNDVHTLEIINQDFFGIQDLTFDVVTSFGFVEHFSDYEYAISCHMKMLKPGGYLVLAVPHFWGLQAMLRYAVLNKQAREQLFETHNMAIMKLREMKRVLTNLGLHIIYADYAMGGSFWIPSTSPKIRSYMRWFVAFLNKADRKFGLNIPSSVLYSPMILSISQRK